MNFDQFGLEPIIRASVKDEGFVTPTPIQERAIPPILLGRDLLGLAQTGTGKTAAFVLPILQRLLAGRSHAPRALVLAPTRELAEQIDGVIAALGRRVEVKSLTVYGGVSAQKQIRALRQGADVVVACPGRLLDHIRQRTIDLSRIEVLVLDEADRMFDMGFLPGIRQILKTLPASRQTLLFSATMPAEVRSLAREILRDPVTIEIAHASPPATISHAVYPVEAEHKPQFLAELLRRIDRESVVVFTRTKHRAKKLGRQLLEAGFSATSIQGNLSQNKRQEALDGFRCGTYQILVATDIAARGLDISTISHVINYDMPDTAEAYTHRIGRTGRAARHGDAFTLVTREDGDMTRAIERLLGYRLKRAELAGFTPRASELRPDAERTYRYNRRGWSGHGTRRSAHAEA